MSAENKGFEEELKSSDLYSKEGHWYVNAGGKKIHAARTKGFFRNLKWITQTFYILFFVGPWLQWNSQKAILFDIPHRQFHLFGITVWPQDIWILALTLILLAITLVGITAVASRVFCGYFCFHTVWVDWYTLIEQFIEGKPGARRKLDLAPLNFSKFMKKSTKFFSWIVISFITGFSFTAYFIEPVKLLNGIIHFNAPAASFISLSIVAISAFIFPGFLREQTCFWLCPYARIQSVMVDKDTIIPTYDLDRGEPRTKYSQRLSTENPGDCIDCHSCVNVCPTGVDVRNGFQEGCITCGLCIDACNTVMKKTNKPKGLIRYMSRNEMTGKPVVPLYKRPRVLVYSAIFLVSLTGIVYGLSNISPLEFTVLHERQPLFTRMSDGSIQNKYTIKILNKTKENLPVEIDVTGYSREIPGLVISSEQGSSPVLKAGKMVPFNIFLKAPEEVFKGKDIPIKFTVTSEAHPEINRKYKSVLIGPK